uniref:Triosephosphate isomerase n=1 Tax=Lygus hesperus TaxID=30085 RepID=A0A0A9YXM3_LYGHE
MNTAYYSIGIGVKRVLERGAWRGEPRVVRMLSYSYRCKKLRPWTMMGFGIPFLGGLGGGGDAHGKFKALDVQMLATDGADKSKSGVGNLETPTMGTEPIEKDRKFVTGGNFKMNGSKKELETIIGHLSKAKLDPNVEVFVSPPAVYMEHTKKLLPKNIALAAQNCYMKEKGPFTGEISPGMIKDVGGTWVILGHSERRVLFGESDNLIGEKICRALHDGLKVVACIGESLKERESGQAEEVILDQLDTIASSCCGSWANIVIAYEPVWAIGTGKVATPEQAQEMHCVIRSWIKDNLSECASDVVRIIYGGSVTKDNCRELAKMPDIDGFLVGGASIKEEFVDIINVLKDYNDQVKSKESAAAKAAKKDDKKPKKEDKKAKK